MIFIAFLPILSTNSIILEKSLSIKPVHRLCICDKQWSWLDILIILHSQAQRSWHTFCANCCTMCLTVASFIEHNLIVLYSNCNHSVWWIYCILLCLSVFSLKWPPTHFCRILTSKGAQCLSDQESPRRENHIIQQNEKLGHVPDIRWKT